MVALKKSLLIYCYIETQPIKPFLLVNNTQHLIQEVYLDSTERSNTHVKEDAIQHRHGDELPPTEKTQHDVLQSYFRQLTVLVFRSLTANTQLYSFIKYAAVLRVIHAKKQTSQLFSSFLL